MQRSTRYVLAVVSGVAATALAYVAAAPVLDDGLAWFAAGLNGLTWAVAVGAYLHGYELGIVGSTPQDDVALAAKLGGLVGGFAALGVSGLLALVTAVTSLRLGLVVGSIAFGFGVGCLCLGIGAASLHLEQPDAVEGAATPADD